MRFSEAWLREYVNPSVSTDDLVAQLTMAGLEVDSVEPAAGAFNGVRVGEVLEVQPHPQADRLRVCRVAAGGPEPLQIVCGAPNARVGLKAPLAVEGAELPGGMKIGKSQLRGVDSFGMLCSAKELGFEDGQAGLLKLAADAPTGADLREYLKLDDSIIEVDLTPNRADCLSVQGIAREVALLNGLDWSVPAAPAVEAASDAQLAVHLKAPEACPRYLGRLIRNVDRTAETPLWMKERLRRSGVRSLGPLVDVTNYVLLDLGQPLHAFDAAKLEGSVQVRLARAGETLRLLNDQEITLDGETLVIADEAKALALAGIMGGADSAVGEGTRDIFLECAFFTPLAIMGKARRYGLATDSSHRFERGVDPEMQTRAIEYATQLILDICGGEAGPIVEALAAEHLPERAPVQLRSARVAKLLGIVIADEEVESILRRLGMQVQKQPAGWQVTPPGFRFDIAIEVDLIEEIGRVYGYNRLPRTDAASHMELRPVSEAVVDIERIKDLLVDRGYQEAITYSFVDAATQLKIEPELEVIPLQNPISSELGVMRTGLWCGLLDAALKNLNRQQTRVRLFEAGLRFTRREGAIVQEKSLAGLVLGDAREEQWGEATRRVDFFDLKADLEAILRLTGHEGAVRFAAGQHPALHPGQSALITLGGEKLGWAGMLHPSLEKELGFDSRVFLFELDQGILLSREVPAFKPLSRFPQVRRDLAVIVDETVKAADVAACVQGCARDLIRQVLLFDVYQGPGIEAGKKSLALGLVLQDDADTLTDARVDAVMTAVVAELVNVFNGKLRD